MSDNPDDRRVQELLTRTAELVTVATPSGDALLRRAQRRRRRQQLLAPALAATAAALIVVPAALLAVSVRQESEPADQAPDSAVDPRIPQLGESVFAQGVVADQLDGTVRLCPEFPAFPTERCSGGVELRDLQRTALQDGRTSVVGIWQGDAIAVTSETLPSGPRLTGDGPQPPCAPPPGGWPPGNVPYDRTGPDFEGWRDFMARHGELGDRLLQLTVPSGDRTGQMLLLRAEDEAQRSELSAELIALFGPDRVCSVVAPDPGPEPEEISDAAFSNIDGPAQVYWTRTVYPDGASRRVVEVFSRVVTSDLLELERRFGSEFVLLSPLVQTTLSDGRVGGD